MMYEAYVAHKLPNETKPKKAPDAWHLVCIANTEQGARDEATRQIRGWNEGRKNPTLYFIHILELTT